MRGTDTSDARPPELALLERSIISGLSRARSGGGSFPAQFSELYYEAVGDGECTVRLGRAPQVLDASGNFLDPTIYDV